ncbi:MAG TPA: hypothetical protein EYP23_01015 [Thermoplasmata archaeon]|nr:hypothetical protein [Thermoplasmata archaeon]
MTQAVILAAGRGERFQELTEDKPKPLIQLLGLTLIERVILTAKQVGVTDFVIVVGYQGDKIQKHLGSGEKLGVKITYVENKEWKKGNGVSLSKTKKFVQRNFLLLMSDHIFDESVLARLLKENVEGNKVVLVVDRNIENNEFVDEKDATKVLVKEDKIVDIGKSLREYNAYDTGIFYCPPLLFDALEKSMKKGDDSLTGGIKALAEKGCVRTLDIQKGFWVDVDNEKLLQKTQALLLSKLKKPSDGPVSRYLNRPVSTRITKWLSKKNITPNQITVGSFLLCCLSTLFFLLGGDINLALGGLIAQISSIVDGCDGEIARLKFLETEFGSWIDAVLDRYADAFLIIGLIFYVYLLDKNLMFLLIGFFSLLGTFMSSYTADKYDGFMKKQLQSKGHYLRVGRDVRIFLIFVFTMISLPLSLFIDTLFLIMSLLLLLAVLTNGENLRRIILMHKVNTLGCCL